MFLHLPDPWIAQYYIAIEFNTVFFLAFGKPRATCALLLLQINKKAQPLVSVFCWWNILIFAAQVPVLAGEKCAGTYLMGAGTICAYSAFSQRSLSEDRVPRSFNGYIFGFPTCFNEHILEATFYRFQTNGG